MQGNWEGLNRLNAATVAHGGTQEALRPPRPGSSLRPDAVEWSPRRDAGRSAEVTVLNALAASSVVFVTLQTEPC